MARSTSGEAVPGAPTGATVAGAKSPGALHAETGRLRRELEERDDRLQQGKRELAAQARQLRRCQSDRLKLQTEMSALRSELQSELREDDDQAATAPALERHQSSRRPSDDGDVEKLREEEHATMVELRHLRAESAAHRAELSEDGSATSHLVGELRELRKSATVTERERSRERGELRDRRSEVGKLHSELAVSRRDVAAKNLNIVQLRAELQASVRPGSPSSAEASAEAASEVRMARIELQEARESSVRFQRSGEFEEQLRAEVAMLHGEKTELHADNARLANDAAFLTDAMELSRQKQVELEEQKLEFQRASELHMAERQRESELYAKLSPEASAHLDIANLRSDTRGTPLRQKSTMNGDQSFLSPCSQCISSVMGSPLPDVSLNLGSLAPHEVVQLRVKSGAQDHELEAAAQSVIAVSSASSPMRSGLRASSGQAEVNSSQHRAEIAERNEVIMQLTQEVCSLQEAAVIRDQLIEQLRQEILSQSEHVRILKEAEQVYSKLQRRSAEKVEKLTEQKLSQKRRQEAEAQRCDAGASLPVSVLS